MLPKSVGSGVIGKKTKTHWAVMKKKKKKHLMVISLQISFYSWWKVNRMTQTSGTGVQLKRTLTFVVETLSESNTIVALNEFTVLVRLGRFCKCTLSKVLTNLSPIRNIWVKRCTKETCCPLRSVDFLEGFRRVNECNVEVSAHHWSKYMLRDTWPRRLQPWSTLNSYSSESESNVMKHFLETGRRKFIRRRRKCSRKWM